MILGNLPPIHPAPVAQALLPVLLSSFLPRLCSGHFYVGTRGGASGGVATLEKNIILNS